MIEVQTPEVVRLKGRLAASGTTIGGSGVLVALVLGINLFNVKTTLMAISPMIVQVLHFYMIFAMVITFILFYVAFILLY